jgi:transmembrane sensor
LKATESTSTSYHDEPDNIDIAQSVYEELIAWSVKLNSGLASEKDFQLFREWRALDSSHEAAWQKLYREEKSFDALSSESKQIATETLKTVDKHRSNLANRRRTLKLLSLTMITIISSALLINNYAPWQQEFHYATSVGQRGKFLLTDGTQLVLNTSSEVDVKFSLFKREIKLNEGEIYIDTGKDVDSFIGRRSFWVRTNNAKLEALGTRFSVKQQMSGSKLHVAQGIVAMYVGDDLPVQANANESYVMPDATSAPIKMSGENNDQVIDPMAWIDGMLVVKQIRLEDFVNELSRYQHLSLVCEPNACNLTVSGVFQLNRSDAAEHAIQAVARTLPIYISKQDGTIFIRKK